VRGHEQDRDRMSKKRCTRTHDQRRICIEAFVENTKHMIEREEYETKVCLLNSRNAINSITLVMYLRLFLILILVLIVFLNDCSLSPLHMTQQSHDMRPTAAAPAPAPPPLWTTQNSLSILIF